MGALLCFLVVIPAIIYNFKKICGNGLCTGKFMIAVMICFIIAHHVMSFHFSMDNLGYGSENKIWFIILPIFNALTLILLPFFTQVVCATFKAGLLGDKEELEEEP